MEHIMIIETVESGEFADILRDISAMLKGRIIARIRVIDIELKDGIEKPKRTVKPEPKPKLEQPQLAPALQPKMEQHPLSQILQRDEKGKFKPRAKNKKPLKMPKSNFKTIAPEALLELLTSGAKINLSGYHLAGVNFSGLNLAGANFSGANLVAADFSGADLSWANLTHAYVRGANFSGANLTGANLIKARGMVHTTGISRNTVKSNPFIKGIYTHHVKKIEERAKNEA